MLGNLLFVCFEYFDLYLWLFNISKMIFFFLQKSFHDENKPGNTEQFETFSTSVAASPLLYLPVPFAQCFVKTWSSACISRRIKSTSLFSQSYFNFSEAVEMLVVFMIGKACSDFPSSTDAHFLSSSPRETVFRSSPPGSWFQMVA